MENLIIRIVKKIIEKDKKKRMQQLWHSGLAPYLLSYRGQNHSVHSILLRISGIIGGLFIVSVFSLSFILPFLVTYPFFFKFCLFFFVYFVPFWSVLLSYLFIYHIISGIRVYGFALLLHLIPKKISFFANLLSIRFRWLKKIFWSSFSYRLFISLTTFTISFFIICFFMADVYEFDFAAYVYEFLYRWVVRGVDIFTTYSLKISHWLSSFYK
jgi:hypothetical protein